MFSRVDRGLLVFFLVAFCLYLLLLFVGVFAVLRSHQ